MVNHGDINICIESADVDSQIGCGIMEDVVGANVVKMDIVNDGRISLAKSAPGYDMAEVVRLKRTSKGEVSDVKLYHTGGDQTGRPISVNLE